MSGHLRHTRVHAMSDSFSARGASMAAAFGSIVSALHRYLACRHRVHRLVTVGVLMSTLVVVGATHSDAQEVVEYYGTDALGSIRIVFAADGTVKAQSDYLPFGEEFAPTGALPTQRFTGQQRDAEENLDYFNARSYQTRTGRMTTTDPVFSALFVPQRWNRYTYALNNPLSYVDPDGRDPILRFTDATSVVGRTSDNSGNALPWSLVAGDYTANGIEAIPGWAFFSPSHGAIETWGTPELDAWLASFKTDAGNQDADAESGSGEQITGPDTGFVERPPLPPPSETTTTTFGVIAGVVVGANAAVTAAKFVSPFIWGAVGPKVGDVVYRVYGGLAGPYGKSWTNINPGTVSNYRNVAGLPNVNSGRFVIEGIIRDTSQMTVRSALPLNGNAGGLLEMVFQNPSTAIQITRVSGMTPPF
jgi:RHS repeat-associated protein